MAKRTSDSLCVTYQPEWATEMDFICASDKGETFAYCRVSNVHVNVSFGGIHPTIPGCDVLWSWPP